MDVLELKYALALQLTPGVGSIIAKKLILNYGNATTLFRLAGGGQKIPEISTKIQNELFNSKSLQIAEDELEKAEKNHFTVLYFLNDDYPGYLLHCLDAPVMLFYDGNKDLNDYNKIISIVGTRNITSYGIDFCRDLLKNIKEYNPLIVSGFAYGVDICAHTEALKNDLHTTAVLAHGYGTLYPKTHKKYYAPLKESGGFLTEFMFNDQPYRENFLKRNRIIAGMSQATIVIESAVKGGAMVTADIAGSYQKDVYAVPGKTTDIYSAGCNKLIKENRAAMITSAEDLIFELGWEKTKKQTTIVQPKLFVELEGDEKRVYDFLNAEPQHMDVVSRALNLPIYKMSSTLFQLEMKALIKALPGKMIQKV